MKLVVGLGNPSEKFMNTRHNSGFMFVETLVKYLASPEAILKPEYNLVGTSLTDFEYDKYFESEVAYLMKAGERLMIFAKPQTFMNGSGTAVRKLIDKNKIALNDVYVAYDDLDITLGNYKITANKSPKAHNGILSIIEHIKSQNFTHVRIGVDSRQAGFRIPGEDYVLMKMKDEERKQLDETIHKAILELTQTVSLL